jgi:erythromycin esterase-like protein
MWGNYEMVPFISWLNDYNQDKAPGNKVAFYGLDVYSFWEWTENIEVKDKTVQQEVENLEKFFAPYHNDALLYSDAVRHGKPVGSQVSYRLWKAVEKLYNNKQPEDEIGFLLWQQALLALDGERYFRILVSDRVQAINLRDGHMAETIKRLLALHGKNSRLVVWAHNGHSGDAHFSSMSSAGYTALPKYFGKTWGVIIFSALVSELIKVRCSQVTPGIPNCNHKKFCQPKKAPGKIYCTSSGPATRSSCQKN